jgi:hypothetical protein
MPRWRARCCVLAVAGLVALAAFLHLHPRDRRHVAAIEMSETVGEDGVDLMVGSPSSTADAMVTIFTILREEVEGEDWRVTHLHALVAIHSWLFLAPKIDILLFASTAVCGNVTSHFRMLLRRAGRVRWRCVPVRCRSAEGVPTVDCLFADAARIARTPLLMYSNADMLYFADLLTATEFVAADFERFLLVGKRRDYNMSMPLDASVISELATSEQQHAQVF